MNPVKDKDYWTRVGLGLVMAAGIAAALVWGLAKPGSWLKAFNKTDNMIVQVQLYQLASAEKKHLADRGRLAVDWNSLAEYGFKPDGRVLMRVMVVDLDWGGGRTAGFWAQANHVSGSEVFCISSFNDGEVRGLPEAEPLAAPEFAVTVKSEAPLRLSGPSFLVFRASFPGGTNPAASSTERID